MCLSLLQMLSVTLAICIRVRSLLESEQNKNHPPVPPLLLCTYVCIHTQTPHISMQCTGTHKHAWQGVEQESQGDNQGEAKGIYLSDRLCHLLLLMLNKSTERTLLFFLKEGTICAPNYKNSPRSLIKKTAQGHNLTL